LIQITKTEIVLILIIAVKTHNKQQWHIARLEKLAGHNMGHIYGLTDNGAYYTHGLQQS